MALRRLQRQVPWILHTWCNVTCARTITQEAVPTTHLVKRLREQSGAPISDVKASLQQANWDLPTALELLKQKGLAAAAKKSGRAAAEGLIVVETSSQCVSIVEVNSETDFVARNSTFIGLARSIASAVLNESALQKSVVHHAEVQQEALKKLKVMGAMTAEEACAQLAAQVRENILLRRGYRIHSPDTLGSYVHNGPEKGVGKIAAVVEVHSSTQNGNDVQLQHLANNLAMHVAGMKPLFTNTDNVPEDYLAARKDMLTQEAMKEGKAGKVLQQVVQGRLAKHLQEVCLAHQTYILDDSKKVQDVLTSFPHGPVGIRQFWRVECGEGVQSGVKNLAAEVAEMLKDTK